MTHQNKMILVGKMYMRIDTLELIEVLEDNGVDGFLCSYVEYPEIVSKFSWDFMQDNCIKMCDIECMGAELDNAVRLY